MNETDLGKNITKAVSLRLGKIEKYLQEDYDPRTADLIDTELMNTDAILRRGRRDISQHDYKDLTERLRKYERELKRKVVR